MHDLRQHQSRVRGGAILPKPDPMNEPIVITGIGIISSVGRDRESVWRAVREGRSGVRRLGAFRGLPTDLLLGAVVDFAGLPPGRMKVFPLSQIAAREAIDDAQVHIEAVEADRFGCFINAHMGDTRFVDERLGLLSSEAPAAVSWWDQFLPNTACVELANRFGLYGPRVTYSTACASSLIAVMSAVRAIRDNQCDIALTGGADAIDPLFAAGFRQMGVLAEDDDPQGACRPFDRNRHGFVLGEGAAMMVVERLSHAIARAQISTPKSRLAERWPRPITLRRWMPTAKR